jgi:hypothetical protein
MEKIDVSSARGVEKDQQALARSRKQVSSVLERALRRCRKGFAAIGKWVSSSMEAIAEWAAQLKSRKMAVRVRAPVKISSVLYQYRNAEDRISEELTSISDELRSSFSKLTERLPTTGRFKKLKIYSFKQWVSFTLIILVSLYLLIITYIVANRYRSFNSPNITEASLADSMLVQPPTINRPPLAMIAYSPEIMPPRGTPSDKPSSYSFWPKRITLRHVEGWGEGVSYGTDYSTIAMMIAPDYRAGRIMPMLDLRGHRFDNDTYAANIGIAGRYIPRPNTFCQILGLNLFYDWRQGSLGNYQQIGAGLEVLGKRWDLRANVYAPFSVKERKLKCVFDNYEDGYFAIHRRCEFTSYGYNAEVGYYLVRSKDFLLYAAGGPYYLVQKCHGRTGGGEFRIRPQYKDYLALDFSVSHDNVFGTVYQAQVILYLPLYQLSKHINKRPCNLFDQQIYQPIERFEVMPLGRRSCWHRNF